MSTAAASRPDHFNSQTQVVRALSNTTERVSVDSNGQEGNHWSQLPAVSSDGRYVAFYSLASNLVISDTNDTWDVFIHDRETDITERVSVDSNGTQSNGYSASPDISADGRYVAFHSYATNLVISDTNGVPDVFLHDRWTGATELISLTSDEQQANGPSTFSAISADGRYVAFNSDASNISADGRYVAFNSDASNLGTSGGMYVRDRELDVTEQVDVNAAGEPGNDYSSNNDISADGRYIAFDSWATNLVDGDTNASKDIFVRDRLLGVTERVSVDSAGQQGDDDSLSPANSADGRYVAFSSYASNLASGDTSGYAHIFVHDRLTGVTERVSVSSGGQQANALCGSAAISADGRYVAFHSQATNLVSGDTNNTTDVFVHDWQTGLTRRMSVSSLGQEGSGISLGPALTADGYAIAFWSLASNLVENDANNVYDVFVHDWQASASWLPIVLQP